MKSQIILTLAVTLTSVMSFAQSAPKLPSRIIKSDIAYLSVKLNPETVKCSQADYSMPTLKVLIPSLANVTLFDHRNSGEGAPCVGAGACTEKNTPDAVLAAGPSEQVLPVEIILTQVFYPKKEGGCQVVLTENIKTTINGVVFRHEREQLIGDREPADCKTE